VFQTLVLSVSFVFFCMLQLLHLDVLKKDRVFHTRCAWEAAGGADDVQGGMGDILGDASSLLVRCLARPARYTLVCSVCVATSGRPRPERPDSGKSVIPIATNWAVQIRYYQRVSSTRDVKGSLANFFGIQGSAHINQYLSRCPLSKSYHSPKLIPF
jgi:hypothetical protein